MYSALVTARYQCSSQSAVYARGEVFSDADGFMSTVIIDKANKKTGYKLTGLTAGAEYKPTAESYIKLEGRVLQMDENQYIFYRDGYLYNYRFEIMINAGVTFDLLKNLKTRVTEVATTPPAED